MVAKIRESKSGADVLAVKDLNQRTFEKKTKKKTTTKFEIMELR